jgi:integrase
LNLSQRKARVRERFAENRIKLIDEEIKSPGIVTFREQAESMLEGLRTRYRKPLASGTLENYERMLHLHVNPILGNMPLSEIYSRQLNLVVQVMAKKGKTTTTIINSITLAKQVMRSALNADTGEPLYPRKWNAYLIDLPIIYKERLNTPIFSREILTLLAAHEDRCLRMLFTLAGATGLRIGELLAIEIDKYISPNFLSISIFRRAHGGNARDSLTTPPFDRYVDLHPDVASRLKTFTGERTSGFLFRTSNDKPRPISFVLRKLNLALKTAGHFNKRTGREYAGLQAFRRARETFLRNETACPDGVYKFWMGFPGERDSEVKHDLNLRRFWAETCGYGFDLPPVLPIIPGVIPKAAYQ